MRDMVDTLIEVNKINKFSHISHTWYLYKMNIRVLYETKTTIL
jgi:hypothetical protein